MRLNSFHLFLIIALLFFATGAQAAISCSISAPSLVTGYDAAAPTNSNQTYFTVSCTRGLATDPLSVAYSASVDNGLQPVGINNRAAFGANRMKYDTYSDAACGTLWKSNKPIAGTITFTTTGTVSTQTTYYRCIPTGQAGLVVGPYTDTVILTLSYGPNPQSTATGSFNVSITPPSNCQITTSPANINFTYTAFGGAVLANTSFSTFCSSLLPYTMALDATFDVVTGLNYTLALNTTANTGGANPRASTGTGAIQTFFINGNMAAGQAGTCSTSAAPCTGSQARTLTITY
jgi:spore coat protein U-like protein